MIRKTSVFCATFIFLCLLTAGCSYNPFLSNHHETGSPLGAAAGAAIGAGSMAALNAPKAYLGIGGLVGGTIGYYVTTLRYDAGGIIQAGGQVYKIGDKVGIYIPTDQLFEPNTDAFLPEAPEILNSVVAVLERYPNHNILISGNTSGFYRSKWEQRISERRAQKVASFLWNAGINYFKNPGTNFRKIQVVGYGDYFPLSQTITNQGIRTNSRIQITAYPSNYELGIDKRQLSAYNVGSMDSDAEINAAPASKPCTTSDLKGECI
jgi:outer membrane protein OmpA-like peptidoglycan-associated protein